MVRACLLAAGVAGTGAVFAQSRWIHSLTVPAEIEYDSNPGMTPGRSAGATRWLRVTPSLTTKYVYGNEEFALESVLSAEKSSNTAVAQDRLDPRLRAAWKHVDELNTTEVAALLDRRAFRDVDLRRQVPLGVDGTRTLFALTGSWSRDLDARTAFNADLRQEWERSSGGLAPDLRHTVAAARLKRAHDERNSWYAGVDAQVVRADGTGAAAAAPAAPQRATVAGALLGLDHAFSEGWHVNVSAGPLRFTQPKARTDWQRAVTTEYKGERWRAGADLLRAPSVDTTVGGLVVTQEVRVRVGYDLGPLSRVEAEAGVAREKAAGNRRALASVSWVRELTPSWQLMVKGTLQRQEGPTGLARSNRLGVTLVYSAPDL